MSCRYSLKDLNNLAIRWTNTCNLYTGEWISGKCKCCDRPVDETRLHYLQIYMRQQKM